MLTEIDRSKGTVVAVKGRPYRVELNPNAGRVTQRIRTGENGLSIVGALEEPAFRAYSMREGRYLAHSEVEEVDKMSQGDLSFAAASLAFAYNKK